jgi:hypothetical protein
MTLTLGFRLVELILVNINNGLQYSLGQVQAILLV